MLLLLDGFTLLFMFKALMYSVFFDVLVVFENISGKYSLHLIQNICCTVCVAFDISLLGSCVVIAV